MSQRNITRAALLRAVAGVALAQAAAAAASASTVVGIGSSVAGPSYDRIFASVGLQTPPSYTCTSSVDICFSFGATGPATTGFLNNDATLYSLPAGLPVDFAGSDVLTTAQISAFRSTYGYQLIQIPSFGIPLTLPFNYAGKAKNAAIKLADSDLCNIFSGRVRDWSGLTKTTGLSGTITVVYRQDNVLTSFLLTNHLASVCPAGILPGGGSFFGTNKLATLFPGYTTSPDGKSFFVPPGTYANAVPISGSSGEQTQIVSNAKSIGYLGPDYTAIAATPTLATGVTQAPFVASVIPAGSTTPYLPNLANTTAALASFKFTPVATDPNTFGVLVPVPTNGYPIVGYGTLLLSSRYSSAAKVSILKTFLGGLYNQAGTCASCITDITTGGFVPIPGVTASKPPTKLAGQIVKAYLSNTATVPITVGSNGR